MGDAALARVGRSRQVVMTMPVFSGVYNAVAESDLIALIPAQLARRVAERMRLDIYAAPIPLEPPRIFMVWHKRSTRSPAHAWLRGEIAKLMAPLDDAQRH